MSDDISVRIGIHGAPDRKIALEAGVVNAVNYGTTRSGTSLIFTILCEWFPRNTIVKTHAFLIFPPPHNPLIVVSYRDFRDAAISAFRRHAEPGQLVTEEHIYHFAAGQRYNAFVLGQYHKQRPSSLFIRYEDDVFDLPRLVRKLADYFSVSLSDSDVEGLVERHNIDQHRKEADGTIPRPPNAPWMDSHIHDGEIGCWKRFTPEPLQTLFTDLLSAELAQWRYT